MRDYLAWRLAFGVTTPSPNTVVQPEYDDMRPAGVTNHLGRMMIPDMAVKSDEDFCELLRLIDIALEPAVEQVMSAKPNAFVLGISALAVWGGTLEWGEELKRRIRKVAGWDIPVAIATDAVFEAL
jgi:maleate isomerase